jgi:CARDB
MSRELISPAAVLARLAALVGIATAALLLVSALPATPAEQAPLAEFIGTFHQCTAEYCMDLLEFPDGRRVAKFSHKNGTPLGRGVFNVRTNNGGQEEICGTCSWTFSSKPGRSYEFSIQHCYKGIALSPSTCGDWSHFRYTAPKTPQVAEAPQVVPLPDKGKKGPGDYAVKEVEALPDKGKGAGAYVLKDNVGKQGADLAVVGLSGPSNLQAGLSGTYTVTVKNKGDVSAPVELHIIFAKALDQTGQIVAGAGLACSIGHDAGINAGLNCTGGQLAAGEAATVVVQGRGQNAGGGTLLATLNPGHAVQESNYDNNMKQLNVTIN